ncbi:HNH endonuclease [Pantoea anthophila]|uniref:HNH endonuclease n=1 Tax=Pantoea anthophila TaxID=470931 RepID=UPI003521D8D4
MAYNCYGLCVLTGASDFRCEAAHLVPHARKGGASYLNGIFLRCDHHKLFDNNLCAIDPVTMEMIFRDAVLASDPDLRAHHRRKVITRNPIKAENLQYRWEVYKSGNDS